MLLLVSLHRERAAAPVVQVEALALVLGPLRLLRLAEPVQELEQVLVLLGAA